MAIVVGDKVLVDGLFVGYADQLKNEVKDGTVLNLEYDRPLRYEVRR